MRLPTVVSTFDRDLSLAELPAPLDLDALVGLPPAPWEVELGFGKGKHLLRRAAAEPERRFLGVEVASKYHRRVVYRARRDGLRNLVAVRGEALLLLATVLPRGFAEALHVYFPDPWPKSRHHKRRLFDPETVDLVLGVLRPGGRLSFATDFLDYGERVLEILAGVPGLDLNRVEGPWPDGARTHYEAKYLVERRPILRAEAVLGGQDRAKGHAELQVEGAAGVVAWVAPPPLVS